MSVGTTCAAQRGAHRELGLRLHEQPPLRDVDTIDGRARRRGAGAGVAVRHARWRRSELRSLSPLSIYGDGLRGGDGPRRRLRLSDGTSRPLALERYLGPADATDEPLLDGAGGPVLDVGCGPGRHLHALAAPWRVRARRRPLGRSPSGWRVAAADTRSSARSSTSFRGRARGARALLLDGNIGIGGAPDAAAARLAALLRDDGEVLVGARPPGSTDRDCCGPARDAETASSAWFPWARVAFDDIETVAASRDSRCGAAGGDGTAGSRGCADPPLLRGIADHQDHPRAATKHARWRPPAEGLMPGPRMPRSGLPDTTARRSSATLGGAVVELAHDVVHVAGGLPHTGAARGPPRALVNRAVAINVFHKRRGSYRARHVRANETGGRTPRGP